MNPLKSSDPRKPTLVVGGGAARRGLADPAAFGLRDALALAALFLLVAVIGFVVRGAPPAFDTRLAAVLVATCPAWLADTANRLGSLPVIGFAGVALVLLSAVRRRWLDAVAVVIGLASEIPTELLKVVVDRPRPPTAHEVEAFGSIASYPSGHAVRIVVITGLVVALVVGRSRPLRIAATVLAGTIAGVVGLGRIGAGAHWPSDVLGGILLGAAWLEIALAAPLLLAIRGNRARGPGSPSIR